MVRAIVTVLLVAAVALAQPLEGPWTVLDISAVGSVRNPHVAMRNADTADVFYEYADTIYHAAVSLHG